MYELAWPAAYALLVAAMLIDVVRRPRRQAISLLVIGGVVAVAAWLQLWSQSTYLQIVTWLRVTVALACIAGLAVRGN